MVHEGLERSRGVTESKEHDSWFEELRGVSIDSRDDEGSFPSVSSSESDVVVAPADVKSREPFGSP